MRPLLLLVLVMLPAAAHAARGPDLPSGTALVIRGSVVDAAGGPVPRARFVVHAGRRTNVTADRSGAFAITLPLPSAERVNAAPCTLRVFANARGMRLVLPNGDPTLVLALRIEANDSVSRVVAQSNDERIAAVAATALATRRPTAEIEGFRLVGLEGERLGEPADVPMPHVAQVALGSTAPPTVALAPPPEPSPSPEADRSRSAARVSPGGDRARPERPPEASGDACGCRIKGTIELRSDPPPERPVGVVIAVAGMPALRDSVELALGSPRAFELLDVPCGARWLMVETSGSRPWVVTTPHAVENLGCGRDALVQPRIVLGPRPPRPILP